MEWEGLQDQLLLLDKLWKVPLQYKTMIKHRIRVPHLMCHKQIQMLFHMCRKQMQVLHMAKKMCADSICPQCAGPEPEKKPH